MRLLGINLKAEIRYKLFCNFGHLAPLQTLSEFVKFILTFPLKLRYVTSAQIVLKSNIVSSIHNDLRFHKKSDLAGEQCHVLE